MPKFNVAWKKKDENEQLGVIKSKNNTWLQAMNSVKKEVRASLPGDEQQKDDALSELKFYKG